MTGFARKCFFLVTVIEMKKAGKIQLSKLDLSLGEEWHEKYKSKNGSDHIAGKYALAVLSYVLRNLKPSVVVELGAGIGTMTDMVINHPEFTPDKIICFEDNTFCLEQLAVNLNPERFTNLSIHQKIKDLTQYNLKADLFLGDGGTYTKDDFSLIGRQTTLLYEGERRKHREMYEQIARDQSWEFRATKYRPSFIARLVGQSSKGCWILDPI